MKTITLTEEAYDRLAALKREDESFSELIHRVIPRASLDELEGILAPGEGQELREEVEETRRRVRDEGEETGDRLGRG